MKIERMVHNGVLAIITKRYPAYSHIIMLVLVRMYSYTKAKVVAKYIHDPDMFIDYAIDSEMEMAGSEKNYIKIFNELPNKFALNDNKVENQGATQHCVAYASTNGINETFKHLGLSKKIDPIDIVDYIRSKFDRDIDLKGTMIYYGQKSLTDLGHATDFQSVQSLTLIKNSILNGFSVQTGTGKVSWANSRNGIAVRGVGGNHAVSIVGYNDDIKLLDVNGRTSKGALLIENTWGEAWGLSGRYWLPYDMFDVLFNIKNAIIVDIPQLDEILDIISGYDIKGYDRIRIYKDLRARGYSEKMSLYAIRKYYGMPIPKDMEI